MNRLGQSRLKRTWKVFRDNWTLYLLVLPAIIYVLLFNYAPMYGKEHDDDQPEGSLSLLPGGLLHGRV